MKLSKYLLVGVAALTLVSCEKDDPTFANYVAPKTNTTDEPKDDEPVIPEGATLAEVTIDRNTLYQEIKGFGASDCWAPHFVGKYWTDKRDAIAELLFDQSASGGTTKGIGLSMWRMNLGAGSLEQGDNSGITEVGRRAESYRSGTTDYDWTKCEGQQFFMDKARAYGVESFQFFSNSPLVQYTYNGKARSDRGANANLRPQYYAAFADYMAEVTKHFRDRGYNISHISPFNEPQNGWGGTGQEGSSWTVAEQAKIIRALDEALTAKTVACDILPGETASWNDFTGGQQVLSNYFTAGGENYIGDLTHVKNNLVCGHSYWTDGTWAQIRQTREGVANAAKQYNAEVWQTEWSMLSNDDVYDPNEFPGYTEADEMDIAVHLSRIIHHDLVSANVSSWSYWTSMDAALAEHKTRFMLIRLIPGSGDYTDGSSGDFATTRNLWVLGNYSLCIRPGYIRCKAEVANESANFFGSSYVSPDNGRIVSVYTNNTDGDYYLDNEFEGRNEVMAIKTYTTTADENGNLMPANVRVKEKVVIPAKSVVTVVYDL